MPQYCRQQSKFSLRNGVWKLERSGSQGSSLLAVSHLPKFRNK